MTQKMQEGIAEATKLTRAGKLMEATALIQRALRKLGSEPASRSGGEPIEGSYSKVDEAPELATSEVDTSRNHSGSASQPASRQGASDTVAERQSVAPADADQRNDSAAHSAAGNPTWAARLRHLLRFRQGDAERPWSRRAPTRVPTGPGQFIESTYTNHAGSRRYKLYIPSGYHGQRLPLVIMLHGCTQNPDDAAIGTRLNALAEEELFFVAYPAQAASANSNRCWNWFKANDQQRGSGEPSIIAGITSEVVDKYGLDPRRVYVAGMSAGGAMAAVMGNTYPDLYAAIGVHSGLPHGAAQDLQSAFAAMHRGANGAKQPANRFAPAVQRIVPTIVFHGDRDKTVHPLNGHQVLAQTLNGEGSVTKPRVTVNRGQVPDGHAYTRFVYHDKSGDEIMEHWIVHGAGHAWSGGSPDGSYTDPKGPDASREMLNFFSKHSHSELVVASTDAGI